MTPRLKYTTCIPSKPQNKMSAEIDLILSFVLISFQLLKLSIIQGFTMYSCMQACSRAENQPRFHFFHALNVNISLPLSYPTFFHLLSNLWIPKQFVEKCISQRTFHFCLGLFFLQYSTTSVQDSQTGSLKSEQVRAQTQLQVLK